MRYQGVVPGSFPTPRAATLARATAYILLVVGIAYTGPARAQTAAGPSGEVITGSSKNPGSITVVDADTVERGGHRYRLAGLDAPEIQHARCQAEREAGIRAAARLVELLAGRPHDLVDLGKGGGFGRRLGRLTIAGEDWAVIAVSENHAVACAKRCERKDHDWCKAAP